MPKQNYNDPHRHTRTAHYRLYLSPRTNRPTVICVQDFDYDDYNADRFLSPEAWDTEEAAERALSRLGIAPDTGMRVIAVLAEECHAGDLLEVHINPRTGVTRAVKYDPNH